MRERWRLGCIGVGAMGQALVKGVLRAGLLAPDQVDVSDVDEARCRTFAAEWVLNATTNVELAQRSDVVLVAVKPDQVAGVLREIGPHLRRDALVISIAAGVPLSLVEGLLPEGTAVVRAMPNTPCLVGEGAVALSLGRWVSPEQARRAQALFEGVAQVVTVPEEQMDAVTGLSGSGPAYVFTVIQALMDGGVAAGLSRDTARQLAVHTVLGSARMVAETGQHPVVLRDMVTSPGGTTITGLAVLERRAVPSAFMDAVVEATRRSRELGRAAAGNAPTEDGREDSGG